MSDMPTPWSPFIGPPWTSAQTWSFAVMLANDRAVAHKVKQRINWDAHNNEWRVGDAHTAPAQP